MAQAVENVQWLVDEYSRCKTVLVWRVRAWMLLGTDQLTMCRVLVVRCCSGLTQSASWEGAEEIRGGVLMAGSLDWGFQLSIATFKLCI